MQALHHRKRKGGVMYDSEKSPAPTRHGLCEVHVRSSKKKLLETEREQKDEDKKLSSYKESRSCTQQNQLLFLVALIVCFITFFRLFSSGRPTERRAIICTNLENCDISGKKIIFGPQENQEIRNIKFRTDEEVQVEPGTITKKMTTQEWNSIYKRKVIRERYIIGQKNKRQDPQPPMRQKPSNKKINENDSDEIIENFFYQREQNKNTNRENNNIGEDLETEYERIEENFNFKNKIDQELYQPKLISIDKNIDNMKPEEEEIIRNYPRKNTDLLLNPIDNKSPLEDHIPLDDDDDEQIQENYTKKEENVINSLEIDNPPFDFSPPKTLTKDEDSGENDDPLSSFSEKIIEIQEKKKQIYIYRNLPVDHTPTDDYLEEQEEQKRKQTKRSGIYKNIPVDDTPTDDYLEQLEQKKKDANWESTQSIAENYVEEDNDAEKEQIEEVDAKRTEVKHERESILSPDEIQLKIKNLLSDSKSFFAYGRMGLYVHPSPEEALESCKKGGFVGLCTKEEVQIAAKIDTEQGIIRKPKCYSGWVASGDAGWYQVEKDNACGGPDKWMAWHPQTPGAHCCGIPNIEDHLKTWFEAGCTEEGLLFPSTRTGGTWITIADPDAAIMEIATRAQMGDRISQASCYGIEKVNEAPPKDKAEDIIWHLLWECYGDRVSHCVIPDAHRLCMITLRHLHPGSTVIVWSKSIDQSTFDNQFKEFNFELRRYDLTLFDGLPQRAQDAARGIQSYFTKHENSYSHWSDLFRSSVLYKYGGIYADLDNIWFRPVETVVSSPQWIPRTQVWEEPEGWRLIDIEDTKYFLEGGIMRMNKKSAFLKVVLETFPVYNDEAAECWSCVGPQHLTETWARLNEDENFAITEIPEIIDSQLIYGVRDYRNEFAIMFGEFDKKIWFGLDDFGCAGAHLFTSSAKGELKDNSLVSYLFNIGGVEMTVHDEINWRTHD